MEALRRDNLSHRAIAQQFNRSQSTVSFIARDAGIASSHRRKRTPVAKDLEGSFGREKRINLMDSVQAVVSQLVEVEGSIIAS